MRKLSIPLFCLATTVTASILGCSFEVGTKSDPAAAPRAAAPPAAPPPAAGPSKPVAALGRVSHGTPPAVTPGSPATPPPAAGIPVLAGTNIFGSGTPDPAGWKGSFYNINAGTAKLPTLANVTPNGLLFAGSLNVASKPMTGGFPGIDPTRNENFALRFEAPLIVDNEADYTFRLVSDDGAIMSIDGTSIVDNDGLHGVAEKTGPVHLVKGTHSIAVDYFQSTGPVALQLFCKKAGGAEVICPTHLL